MMTFQDILQWWNLIYLAPLFVSLVLMAVSVFSGAHAGHTHAGHDIGHGLSHAAHDVGHAIGHALHHGHVDVGHAVAGHVHAHDVEGHAESHEAGEQESALTRILWVLGVGQVPITLLIGIFMLCWGVFGLVANQFFQAGMKYPALYIWPSMGVTFAASSVFTRSIAAAVGRIMPKDETFAISRLQLVGSLGRTIYTTSESAGTVDIRDVYGTVHRVQAKTESGADALPAGTEVMVIDFDDEDKRFVVRRSTL